MIAIHRVKGYMLRHLYEIAATFDRKFDIIFWPTIDLLVFGFLTVYIQKFQVGPNIAGAIVGALLLWSLVYNIQRDISVSLLEDAWWRNFYNLLSTPIKVSEIIVGTMSLSVFKAIITIIFTSTLASVLFNFNLLAAGPVLLFYILNIFIFGWAFGFITASLIFRFGMRVQIFAWSMIAVIYPISGVFYPLSTLPSFLETIGHFLPISYIFDSLRSLFVSGQSPITENFGVILALNACYLIVGIWLYVRGFKNAKNRGWFIHPT